MVAPLKYALSNEKKNHQRFQLNSSIECVRKNWPTVAGCQNFYDIFGLIKTAVENIANIPI